jgi:endo-1,4-beta-xylanase
MKTVTAALLAASLASAAPSKRQAPNLNDLFVAKGKEYFGTITDPGLLQNGQDTAAILATFGQVTAENSMKWDATEPSRGGFTLSGGQQVVDFASQNGLLVRGHTLLWHAQLPSWVRGSINGCQLRFMADVENRSRLLLTLASSLR